MAGKPSFFRSRFKKAERLVNLSFIDHELEYEDQRTNLTSLIQSYLSTMADLGAETWIIHGTLMGWWWNRKVRLSEDLVTYLL